MVRFTSTASDILDLRDSGIQGLIDYIPILTTQTR